MHRVTQLYDILPISVQNFACNLKGVYINKTRFNKDFWIALSEFRQRDSWEEAELREFRDERIRCLVNHCYETVPYYRKAMKQIGIVPSDIRTMSDLSALPLINKQTVNSNPNEFLSAKANQHQCIHAHTSGTTGAGFVFTTTLESIQSQWATFWRHYYNCGIEYGTSQATFSSQPIVPQTQIEPPFWRTINSQNRLYFSAYHESDANLYHYYQEIERRQIKWIGGYPSLMTLLSDYMNRHELHFTNVSHVTTGAENLYEYQISSMQKAFGIKPVQVYGQAENVAFFSQNLDGRIFVDEDAAAVEFLLNDNGNYDVIGTNLYNYAMPLLRYRTGDTVSYTVNNAGKREILSIDGRAEDYLTLPSGRRLGKLDNAFKDAVSIKEAQIYQHNDYSVTLKVVALTDAGIKEAEYARQWLKMACNNELQVLIEYMDAIPRTKASKLRFVVSEVGKI